jgi:hypothetical protein
MSTSLTLIVSFLIAQEVLHRREGHDASLFEYRYLKPDEKGVREPKASPGDSPYLPLNTCLLSAPTALHGQLLSFCPFVLDESGARRPPERDPRGMETKNNVENPQTAFKKC